MTPCFDCYNADVMEALREAPIHCPYCGEPNTVLVDISTPVQQYTEDCAVCCRPIVVDAAIDAEGEPSVRVRREDD